MVCPASRLPASRMTSTSAGVVEDGVERLASEVGGHSSSSICHSRAPMEADPGEAGKKKAEPRAELHRTLGPLTLWGLGVGYVISGMYFGWNLGLPAGGTYGLLAATAIVTVLYVCFVLAYAELACAVPRAGGAFVYAERAFGPTAGFVAGLAQCVEFVFAPPAIAAAIGAYLSLFFPGLHPLAAGRRGLRPVHRRQRPRRQAVRALRAGGGRAGRARAAGVRGADPAAVRRRRLRAATALPHGWWGIMPALPFAIWFYLGIEGVANVAEEARDPQRDIPRGFGSAMATLVGARRPHVPRRGRHRGLAPRRLPRGILRAVRLAAAPRPARGRGRRPPDVPPARRHRALRAGGVLPRPGAGGGPGHLRDGPHGLPARGGSDASSPAAERRRRRSSPTWRSA